MKKYQEIIVGTIAGLVICLPRGMRDLPGLPTNIASERWQSFAVFGGVAGLVLGMSMLSRAKDKEWKHGGFMFFVVGAFSIGIPTIARHYTGSLSDSMNMQSTFFTSIGIGMLIGGGLSLIASKKV